MRSARPQGILPRAKNVPPARFLHALSNPTAQIRIKKDTHRKGVYLFWRRRWDSNPRAVARKLISSQPRYDHFDTSPYFAYFIHRFKSTAPTRDAPLCPVDTKLLPPAPLGQTQVSATRSPPYLCHRQRSARSPFRNISESRGHEAVVIIAIFPGKINRLDFSGLFYACNLPPFCFSAVSISPRHCPRSSAERRA